MPSIVSPFHGPLRAVRARGRGPAALLALAATVLLVGVVPAQAEEPLDWQMINQIRDEGLNRSEVMDTLDTLTERFGARLTGSPSNRAAFEWTRDQLEEWGLENAHLEGFEFGHGWSFDRATVHMISPRHVPLSALPNAWTPGTDGPVRGMAMKISLESEEDFEKHAGKLEGKILFLDDMAEAAEFESTPFRRHDEARLTEMCVHQIPGDRPDGWRKRARKRYDMREKGKAFLLEQGVVAVVEASSRAHGVLRLTGGGSNGDAARHRGVPHLTMMQEHYNRILRMLDEDQEVELEIDVVSRFHEDDTKVYNTIAEIRGSERPDEIVMIGAHLDSWHTGTGATDNGAGSAVMMEAMRILKAVGAEPKRTIRIGLWNGEEQGLHGSRHHVKELYADRPESDDPEQESLPRFLRETTWPIQPKADFEKFSVYFNLDNGSGKIRGVYSQKNAAAVPVFSRWLEPFHDLGAETVTTNRTGGTDHLAFDAVGLPGFQFIQDPLQYFSRTHHTHIDTLEHIEREDLMQASVIVASFAWHAAEREELFPRQPMPKKPPEKKKKKSQDDDEEEDG